MQDGTERGHVRALTNYNRFCQTKTDGYGPQHEIPLLTALEQLAPKDHLCSIYESPEEHLAVAFRSSDRLDRGENDCRRRWHETIVRDDVTGHRR